MFEKRALTKPERDAILAGLRLLQRDLERGCVGDDILPIFNNEGRHDGLSSGDLDLLCQRVGIGELSHDPSRQDVPEIAGNLLSPSIQAEAWPDERPFSVDFDANRYFSQASDEELRRLAAVDFCHDDYSDEVALFMASFDSRVQRVFDYLEVADKGGFECAINEVDAMSWLKAHREGVWALIMCDKAGIELVQADEPEILGRWDWICRSNSMASDASLETEVDAAIDAVRTLGKQCLEALAGRP